MEPMSRCPRNASHDPARGPRQLALVPGDTVDVAIKGESVRMRPEAALDVSYLRRLQAPLAGESPETLPPTMILIPST